MSGAARAVTLFLGGDVMTGRGVDQVLPHPGDPEIPERTLRDARDYVALAERASGPILRSGDPAHVWGEALAELARAGPDVRIVNLETAVTTRAGPWPDKGIGYRMHPANVACLAAAGIDACALANNHVLDYGQAGLAETLATLRGAGLRTAGAGRTLAEARRPAILERAGGERVLVLSVGSASSGIPPGWAATDARGGVDLLPDLSQRTAGGLLDRVREVKRGGDVVVVSIHWGDNWGYEVPGAHVRFAHRLVDGGVDVVHGHSSHHPRPIEVYRGKLVLYGCGELIDDYEGIPGHEEYRGDLVLMYLPAVQGGTGRLLDLRMVPMRIRKMRLQRATPAEAAWLRDRLTAVCRAFGSRVDLAADGSLRLAWEAGEADMGVRP